MDARARRASERSLGSQDGVARHQHPLNTKGYSSTYLAMGFANVRAGTQKRRGDFVSAQGSYYELDGPLVSWLRCRMNMA